MRTVIVIAAAAWLLSVAAPPALAGPAEYNRGYYDCLNGRYDDGQQSRSYRQGCRAAQDEQGDDDGPHHWRPSAARRSAFPMFAAWIPSRP